MTSEISWPQEQRFKLIERQLLWARSLKASFIMDTFNVSRYQAGLDIKRYLEACPDNVLPYSASDRCYRPAPTFKPHFILEDPIEIIGSMGEITVVESHIHQPQIIRRQIIDGIIPLLLHAIDQSLEIRGIYASATTPVGRVRKMIPLNIIYATNRLHVRAYCLENNDFRDFSVSRFLNKPKLFSVKVPPEQDLDWSEFLNILCTPNPELPSEGKELIEREYGLQDNNSFSVRKALVHYFLQVNSIPLSKQQLKMAKTNPWSYPLVASNLSELNEHIFSKKVQQDF